MRKTIAQYVAENYAYPVDNRTIIARIKDDSHPLQGVKDGIWWVIESDDTPSFTTTGNARADRILENLSK